MDGRVLGLVLSLVVGGCSGSTPTPASQASPSATPGHATASPGTQSTGPAGSGPSAQLAAFHDHVFAGYGAIGTLLDTLGSDAAVKNTAAIQKDVADIQAWTKGEADWLAANPAAGCYSAAANYWNIGQQAASKAAATALAGDWDQVEVNFATSNFKKAAEMVSTAHC